MSRQPTALIERVADKLDVADCWIWTGAVNRRGYGVVRDDNGRAAIAHRAIWKVLVGPISEDLDLDHRCRQRRCCNPDHLDPVTRQVNVDRGAFGRGRPRRATCTHGHPLTNGRCRPCINENNRRYRARKAAA